MAALCGADGQSPELPSVRRSSSRRTGAAEPPGAAQTKQRCAGRNCRRKIGWLTSEINRSQSPTEVFWCSEHAAVESATGEYEGFSRDGNCIRA